MSCVRVEEQLSDYLDGELDAVGVAEVEHHLAACTNCRRALEELRLLAQTAGTLERHDAPPQLLARVLSASLHRPEPPKARLWARRYLPLAVAAAAACAVVTTVLVTRSSRVGPSASGARSLARGGTSGVEPGGAPAASAKLASRGGSATGTAKAALAGLRGAGDEAILASARTELARAEKHYRRAVRKLRVVINQDLHRWPLARRRAYMRRAAALDESVLRFRRLTRMAPSDPSAQQMLFGAYRAQIAYLQNAILDGRDDEPPPTARPASHGGGR